MKNIIRKIRIQKGLSLQELASRSEIQESTLEEIETGEAKTINSMILLRLSETLERPIEELLCLPK